LAVRIRVFEKQYLIVSELNPCRTKRSARNFTQPDRFAPERWLTQGKEEDASKKEDRVAFQPFSVGSTGCIGRNLARMELRIILARLLGRYNIAIPSGEGGLIRKNQKIWWSWNKESINVVLSSAR
jgi:cytochrome P450